MPKCNDRITHHEKPVRRRHRALDRKCDTQHERCGLPHDIQPCAFHCVGWPPPAELGAILQFSKRAGGGFTHRVRRGLQPNFEDAPKRGKLKARGWTSRATIQGGGRKDREHGFNGKLTSSRRHSMFCDRGTSLLSRSHPSRASEAALPALHKDPCGDYGLK
jgi:hypothetical protein